MARFRWEKRKNGYGIFPCHCHIPIRHCRTYSFIRHTERARRCSGCAIARKTVLSAASRDGGLYNTPPMPWLTWLIKLANALGCIRRSFTSSLSICQFFCDPQVPYHDIPFRSRNRMVGKLAMGHPGWCSFETMLIY